MPKKKKSAKQSKSDLVLTPGGRRSKKLVHSVKPGESVSVNKKGRARVVSKKTSTKKKASLKAAAASEFVLTPGGFRSRSLVTRIKAGHALQMVEGKTHLMNLATGALKEIRRPPEAKLLTRPALARAGVVPAMGEGWIVFGSWTNNTGKSITSFKTTWRVPPPPPADSGQTIFLFNGIDPAVTSNAILQPVLQWGPSAAGGGSYWSIASWYVLGTGQAFHTNLIKVNKGDTLVGLMTLVKQNGTLFDYKCEFQGIANTSLPINNVKELVWANETLEAYSVQKCSNYPGTPFTALRDIEVKTGSTKPAIVWTKNDTVTDCGQHTVVVSNANPGGEVDLYYKKVLAGQYLFEYKKDEGTAAIDYVANNLQGTTEMWRDKWTTGWSVIEPFKMGSSYYLLSYKGGVGTAAIDRFNAKADGTTELWRATWTKGWTTLKPFYVGGNVYLFCYKSGDGTVAIDQIKSNQQGTTELWRDDWTTGWTIMEPFTMNNKVYLISYKAAGGTVAIDQVKSDLKGTTELWRGDWTNGWTTIKPFTLGGKVYLLSYKVGDGTVAIDQVKSDLKGTTELWRGDWTSGWSTIEPFTMNSKVYLVSYKVGVGTIAIDQVKSDLKGTTELWRGSWTKGWTTIKPSLVIT